MENYCPRCGRPITSSSGLCRCCDIVINHPELIIESPIHESIKPNFEEHLNKSSMIKLRVKDTEGNGLDAENLTISRDLRERPLVGEQVVSRSNDLIVYKVVKVMWVESNVLEYTLERTESDYESKIELLMYQNGYYLVRTNHDITAVVCYRTNSQYNSGEIVLGSIQSKEPIDIRYIAKRFNLE